MRNANSNVGTAADSYCSRSVLANQPLCACSFCDRFSNRINPTKASFACAEVRDRMVMCVGNLTVASDAVSDWPGCV